MTGGVLIIAGTLIVSIRFGHCPRFKLRLALLMLGCGLAAAVSGLIFKMFAIEAEFWTTTFWMFVGEAIFGAALLSVGSYRRQLADVADERSRTADHQRIERAHQSRRRAWQPVALMFAPLSIVQAISSTTALFVFAFGVVLSLLFPRLGRETLSLRDLLQKGAAACSSHSASR